MTRRPRSSTLFPYTTLFRSPERDVKRAALREATRWSPPPELEADFVAALLDGLASGDREVRRLAAEALAAQPPAALAQALPLLEGRGDSAPATIEALVRSGRPELFERARGHLEHRMTEGVHLARLGARLAAPIIAARTARPSMPSCTSRWTTTSSSWRRAGLRPCARCTESEVSRQWSAAFAPSSPALRPRAWRRC